MTMTVGQHLQVIASATSFKWGSGVQAQVKCIRRHLDAIEKILLEPEPESLAASVLRLTNICNELGRENAVLRNDLTGMTLNYNMAEKHAKQLSRAFEKDLKTDEAYVEKLRAELNVTIRSNVWLRGRLTFKDQSLRACRAAEKLLKHDLEQAGWDATKLKRKLARRDAHLMRVRNRLEWIKRELESRSVEEENRKLKRELNKTSHELETARRHLETRKREFALQQRYIEILKEDRRQAREQNKS